MQKEARVELRLPAIEKEQWEQAARAEGFKSLSAYVRAKVGNSGTRLTTAVVSPAPEAKTHSPTRLESRDSNETPTERAHRIIAEVRAAALKKES